MGLYKYIREAWNRPQEGLGDVWQQRLIAWRKEPVSIRLEHPTRLDRAHSLGFKAKQGFVIVRHRVLRGGHTRHQIRKGRRPKHYGTRLNLRKNYQQISEDRVQKDYKNLVVLNSYWVAQDGKYFWYEVILVDPEHPVIKADATINWICQNRQRAYHGRTSAGKKSRGISGHHGKGAEKVRPSQRAYYTTK